MYTQKVWQNKSNLSKPDYIMCVERDQNGGSQSDSGKREI